MKSECWKVTAKSLLHIFVAELKMFFPASGSTLLSHVDRLSPCDLETMTSALTGQTYTCSSRLQLSLLGSFQDNKNVSQSLLMPILGECWREGRD